MLFIYKIIKKTDIPLPENFSVSDFYNCIPQKPPTSSNSTITQNIESGTRLETRQAHYVLAELFKKYFGTTTPMPKIQISEFGKPDFISPTTNYTETKKHYGGRKTTPPKELHFNYSHTKNFIAVAIADAPVGIDLEEKTRIISDAVAKKYLGEIFETPTTKTIKTQTSKPDQLTRLKAWVKKEAYVKMLGTGLRDFNKITLQNLPTPTLIKETEEYFCVAFSEKQTDFL